MWGASEKLVGPMARHAITFSCFKRGRLEHSDEFTVLDWETANGEERFILFMCAMAAWENMGWSSSWAAQFSSHSRPQPFENRSPYVKSECGEDQH